MKRLIVSATILLFVLIAVANPRTALAQSKLVVDDDGQASAADCDETLSAFSSIQDAVDAASPGDTIFVCPGIFDEQVTVTISDLTILGSGVGQTVIRPSAVSVNSSGSITPFPVAAVLAVNDTTGVVVRDLTVDGSLADGGSVPFLNCLIVGYYAGINYRNSSGMVNEAHVTQIQSATACSAALNISSGFTSASDVVVSGSLFDHYGSIGINCSGPNSLCSVTGSTMQGLGPVDNRIQAGIIYRLGAGGELIGNVITDHFYTPAVGMSEFSVGVALFNAETNLNPHLRQDNIFSGNQRDVQRQATAAAFE